MASAGWCFCFYFSSSSFVVKTINKLFKDGNCSFVLFFMLLMFLVSFSILKIFFKNIFNSHWDIFFHFFSLYYCSFTFVFDFYCFVFDFDFQCLVFCCSFYVSDVFCFYFLYLSFVAKPNKLFLGICEKIHDTQTSFFLFRSEKSK